MWLRHGGECLFGMERRSHMKALESRGGGEVSHFHFCHIVSNHVAAIVLPSALRHDSTVCDPHPPSTPHTPWAGFLTVNNRHSFLSKTPSTCFSIFVLSCSATWVNSCTSAISCIDSCGVSASAKPAKWRVNSERKRSRTPDAADQPPPQRKQEQERFSPWVYILLIDNII